MVRRIALLALALFGCTPGVSPSGPAAIHARFDPQTGVIPMPNDIVRDAAMNKLAIPVDDDAKKNKSAAEIALFQALDQRDAWSSRMAAELFFTGALRASSIGPASLRVFDAGDGSASAPLSEIVVTPRLDRPDHLVIDPPAGGWRSGGRYVAAAIGGDRGLAGDKGEPVVADPTFYFLRATVSLLDHPDAFPGATEEERKQNAVKLEKIRQDLAPYFAALESGGVRRGDVVALWAFTITRAPEILMDKTTQEMPIPSDFLRDPASGLVDIPPKADDSPLKVMIKQDLKSFDGFGLSAGLTFSLSRPIDPATLGPGSVRLFEIAADGSTAKEVPVKLESKYGDTGVTLTPMDRPLHPAADHLVVVTDALRSTAGVSVVPMLPGVLALLDVPITKDGASTIGSVPNEDAARVEYVRKNASGPLQLLARSGLIDRAHVAAAWPFRTMSSVEPMRRARDAAELSGISPDPMDVKEESTVQAALGFPLSALTLLRVGKVFEGTILTADALDPVTRQLRPGGGFEPRAIKFTMTIPAGASADQPLKVVIFGHGLMAERRFVLAVADALAGEGLAAISIDFPYHGDRTACVWSGPACIVNPLGQHGEVICPNPCESGSTCAPDGRCVDSSGNGDHLANWPVIQYPQASGGAFLTVDDLIGSRDHFFQAITDLGALERSLKKGDWKGAIGYTIEPHFTYVGQSLGGILGSLFAATHPDVDRAVLNVPGANLIELFRNSTVFKPQMDAFLKRQNVTLGTPEHELVLNVAHWIMDGVDPQNFADYLLHRSFDTGEPLPPRTLLIQMATIDLIIPNDDTKLLETLSGVRRKDYVGEHAFLTIPVEPAYLPGVLDAAKVLGRGILP